MKSGSRGIKFIFWGLTIAAVLVPFAAMAESVFLKDGSIVEGTVLNETKDELTLETSAGLKMQVPAKLLLRKAASDEYKKRVFIYIKNGKEIEGHIVHRENDLLLVRRDLQKPEELKIAQEEVLEISAVRKDTAPKVYTPQYAAQISLIPLRSGSFLLGTDWLGVGFCFLKTGSLVVPLSLVMANMSFGGNTSDSPGESGTSSNDLLQNKTYKTLVLASLGAWVVFTAADAFYSYNKVKKYNREKGISINESSPVFLTVVPVLPPADALYGKSRLAPEGLAFSVGTRF